MIKNYIFTTIRAYWKHKGFTMLNLSGLTIGLTAGMLIMLWVVDELYFDRFHKNNEQLYRIMENQTYSGDIFTFAATPGLLAEALKAEIPEITHATRTTWGDELQFTVGDRVIREEGLYADAEFFSMFSFPFIEGDSATALDDVSSIVISEELAVKYFDSPEAAMGKQILIDNETNYAVRAVFRNVPERSSLQFDFVLPFEIYFQENDWLENWGNNGIKTYVMLADQASPDVINPKIKEFVKERNESSVVDLFIQSFPEAYLHSEFDNGKLVGGRIIFVRLFTVIAAFILLIACINFMNLVTAQSTKRAKEVGVRKVIGAKRGALIGQFLGESVLLALMAMLLTIVLVELILPGFNNLTEKHLSLPYADPIFALILLGITLITGLLAGLYPAFFLSSFNAVKVLKGTFRLGNQGVFLRHGLVVFQFTLSMILIGSTIVVYQQIQYIKDKDLGVERENLIFFPANLGVQQHFESYKDRLSKLPGIQSVASGNQNPLSVGSSTSNLEWEGMDPEAEILFQVIQTGYDFLETTGIQLLEGRDFSPNFSTDTANLILNEEAVKRMGFENPIGQRVTMGGEEGEVIGVVKDFHSTNLHAPIEPLVLRLNPGNVYMTFVRTQAGQTKEALASLEEAHEQFASAYVFEFHFMDENFERMYRTDTLIGKLATYFSVIAILISCLGLFGLAAHTAERRTKEVGVRKVLGASVLNLVTLLSTNFTKLVLLAFVIAAPLTWFLMEQFLQVYAYHIAFSPLILVLTGVMALLIAWATISFQSIKAALVNPTESLKSE